MSEQTQNPAVTEEELDVTIVERPDRGLKISVVYREVNEDGELGDVVALETVRFPVRGSLPVPVMTSFLRLETRINNALAADDEEADQALERTMEEAHDRIVSLVAERSPGAFRIREMEAAGEEEGVTRQVRAKPVLELAVDQILVILSWLAGDTSVADAVAKALTAGRTRSPASDDELEADAAAGPEAAAQAPLP